MDGSVASVPTFDIKAILVAFLNDLFQIHKKNVAPNFVIFMGMTKLTASTLGEIHTGSL
jgi:hypothetical protein